MVGRHNDYPLVRARNPVEGVQEARERDVGARVSVGCGRGGGGAICECSIDVFEQRDGAFGEVREEVVETVVSKPALGEVQHADGVVEFGGKGLDEAGLAGAGRAVEEIATPIRDPAVVVPLATAEECLGVGYKALFEAVGEDDGGEGPLATRGPERFPGGRPGSVDECFSMLLLLGESASFSKEKREHAPRGEEGGDGEQLPRGAALQVDAFGVALALHTEEGPVEVEKVAAGAGEEGERCGETARGVRGVLCLDGELTRRGLNAREDAGGSEQWRQRPCGGPLVLSHPPQEPVVRLVGRGDLKGDQHLAMQVRSGGADRLAGELRRAGENDKANSLGQCQLETMAKSGEGGAYTGEERVRDQLGHDPAIIGGGGGGGGCRRRGGLSAGRLRREEGIHGGDCRSQQAAEAAECAPRDTCNRAPACLWSRDCSE